LTAALRISTAGNGTSHRSARFSFNIKFLKEGILNNRNGLYLIIGVLIAAVVGLGAYAYREETKPEGIEMKIGPDGVKIEKN